MSQLLNDPLNIKEENPNNIPRLQRDNTLVLILSLNKFEIGKQISNYSINYYNGGIYPLPQTVMVRQIPPFHPSPSLPRWSWWSSSS